MSDLSRWMSASALVMLSLCLLPTTTQAQGRAKKPSGVQCAKENGRCAFSGEGVVYYGADSRWSVKRGQNGIDCNNATFGDPAPGVVKSCYVKVNTPGMQTVNRPQGFQCAHEGGTCTFSGDGLVFYGAKATWVVQKHRDKVACNNSVFGDPLPGVVKSCWVKGNAAPRVEPIARFDALENPSSKMCLDSFGRAGAAMAHPCHGHKGNQEWIFDPNLGELKNPSSGLCLDSFGRAGDAMMHPCHRQKGNQQWVYNTAAGELFNPSSNLCVDSFGRAGSIIMHPCHKSRGNQQWVKGKAAPPVAQTAKVVALKSHHGSFVVAEADGTANANRKAAGDWEKWQLVTNSDGTVSLKSHHGKYLVAEADGTANANRTNIGPWERWTLVRHRDGTVSLRSHHGKYLVAEGDGKLNANRAVAGPWEKFFITNY